MINPKLKREKRIRRHRRIRAKISGTSKVPRLFVFRSTKHIYAQLINDEKGETLIGANDFELKKLKNQKEKEKKKKSSKASVSEDKREKRSGKIVLAYRVGKLVAQKALKKKIKKIVFDKGGYKYQGRVKALAEGAREGGLNF